MKKSQRMNKRVLYGAQLLTYLALVGHGSAIGISKPGDWQPASVLKLIETSQNKLEVGENMFRGVYGLEGKPAPDSNIRQYIFQYTLPSQATYQNTITFDDGTQQVKPIELMTNTNQECKFYATSSKSFASYSSSSVNSQSNAWSVGYENEVTVSAEVGVGETGKVSASTTVKNGFNFGVSDEISQEYKFASTSNTYTMNQVAVAKMFSMTWDIQRPQQLAPTFASALDALGKNSASTIQDTYNLVQTFGTHYYESAVVGARAQVQLFSDGSSSQESFQQEAKKTFQGGVTVMNLGISAESTTSSSTSTSGAVSNSKMSYSLNTDGCTKAACGTIQRCSATKPKIIQYTLKGMWELSSRFPQYNAGLQKIKAYYDQAQQKGLDCRNNYCNSHGICAPSGSFNTNSPFNGVVYQKCLCDQGWIGSTCKQAGVPFVPITLNSCKQCSSGNNGGSCPSGTYNKHGGIVIGDGWSDFHKSFNGACQGSTSSSGSAALCCQADNANSNLGECRQCSSCGGDFPFYGGYVNRFDTWSYYWWNSYTYGGQCSGSIADRAAEISDGRKGISLCCKSQPICQWCTTCGGKYPVSQGQTSVSKDWNLATNTKGDRCGNEGFGQNGFRGGINLCCMESTKLSEFLVEPSDLQVPFTPQGRSYYNIVKGLSNPTFNRDKKRCDDGKDYDVLTITSGATRSSPKVAGGMIVPRDLAWSSGEPGNPNDSFSVSAEGGINFVIIVGWNQSPPNPRPLYRGQLDLSRFNFKGDTYHGYFKSLTCRGTPYLAFDLVPQ
ncbi:UNKNOWN [Stylonychia lemnae]|uniref:EGF-like domain-containing protein n=1 Tax=Stylonychia lemnae TaxID=5949 RepID=A0A078AVW8_STYLE|nr:UNKNOWN [Stylonychia lemnae]|eukprot:CDW86236.1 UNKNOWN [Stylonychia lemnae]